MVVLQAADALGSLAPNAGTVGVAILCLLAGMTVPTRYGIERVEGFGRCVASKLPYRPPPGKDAEQAMQEAVEGREQGDDHRGDSTHE